MHCTTKQVRIILLKTCTYCTWAHHSIPISFPWTTYNTRGAPQLHGDSGSNRWLSPSQGEWTECRDACAEPVTAKTGNPTHFQFSVCSHCSCDRHHVCTNWFDNLHGGGGGAYIRCVRCTELLDDCSHIRF